jgi:hypothetical protein
MDNQKTCDPTFTAYITKNFSASTYFKCKHKMKKIKLLTLPLLTLCVHSYAMENAQEQAYSETEQKTYTPSSLKTLVLKAIAKSMADRLIEEDEESVFKEIDNLTEYQINTDDLKALVKDELQDKHAWMLARNCIVFPLKGHIGFMRALSFSPNNKFALSCSHRKTILWNLTNPNDITSQNLEGHNCPVIIGIFSPDGKYVLTI